MRLIFSAKAKLWERAHAERADRSESAVRTLKRSWKLNEIHAVLDVLDLLQAADSFQDLGHFVQYYPHIYRIDHRNKYERMSLSPLGKRNALRVTAFCATNEGQILVKMDMTAKVAVIERVSNHYE